MTAAKNPGWRERTVEFGPGSRLRGIVTLPAGSAPPWSAPAMVILNAGVIHRVGPNRLGVRIARGVSELGVPALRFDLSGLGDSIPREEARSLDDSVALDVRAAFDFLAEAYGAKRFLTFGLCSGGREAFRAAYRDPRVEGAVMIDPYGYHTRGFFLRHYGTRLLRAQSWKSALSGRNQYLGAIRRHFLKPAPAPTSPSPDLGICGLPQFPPTAQLREAMTHVLDRGTRLLFVYTGGMPGFYNYRGQLKDMIPDQFSHSSLRYAYIPESDHTFSSEDHRRELISRIWAWLSETGMAPTQPDVRPRVQLTPSS